MQCWPPNVWNNKPTEVVWDFWSLPKNTQIHLLEAACKKALSYTSSPSYKRIKNILITGSVKTESETTESKTSFQTMVGSNAVMVIENFYGGICYLYINFLFDVFIRKLINSIQHVFLKSLHWLPSISSIELDSTARSQNICRKTTRNIWNGMATGSANGLSGLV